MKIKVYDRGRKVFSLRLPERMILNGFTATFAPIYLNRKAKKGEIRITGKACRKFVREFYKTMKPFGGNFELVNVETKDGTFIKITI
ncbi:MAG: hypothetical protein IKJ57_04765 [Oscillospiraceae bacterium]|nr:hypothetical protein [Oscillospiraceae bacterium]